MGYITCSVWTRTDVSVRLHSHDISVRAPSCTYMCWFRTNFPCKHMLAVISVACYDSWNLLPHDYRCCPFIRLDVPEIDEQATPVASSVYGTSRTSDLQHEPNCIPVTSCHRMPQNAEASDVEPDSEPERVLSSPLKDGCETMDECAGTSTFALTQLSTM
jgi:hypothetical protein